MKWLKRCCWLAAWSVWLWLGFGLYRELPRRIGKKLCEIPLEKGESVLGVAKDSSQIVVLLRNLWRMPDPSLKVYDARTGVLTRDVSLRNRQWIVAPAGTCRNHGVVFTRDEHLKNTGLHVVDLVSGDWKSLSNMMVRGLSVHPTKTWIAFQESARPIDKPRPLVVVDWTTGAEVFIRPQKPEYESVSGPFFLGDSDRLVVPLTRQDDNGVEVTNLEVWKIGSPSVLEKVVRGPKITWRQTTNGVRIAALIANDLEWNIDVFDLEAGRVIFSSRPIKRTRTNPGNYLNSPRLDSIRLARSGRTLMTGPDPYLWNVETGELMWSAKDGHSSHLLADDLDLFEDIEIWDWTRIKRLEDWNTSAIRRLDDAKLEFRCWTVDSVALDCTSVDGRLGVTPDGAVHQLPFEVNWPLLALCQTIMALPLILSWMILRWRRKRRTRLAMVSP